MSDVTWKKIDPSTLSPAAQALYSKVKLARKAAGDATNEFNKALVAMFGAMPEGKTLAISHKFGALSVALVAAEAKAKADNKLASVEHLRSVLLPKAA
jgi:hypothetical protein